MIEKHVSVIMSEYFSKRDAFIRGRLEEYFGTLDLESVLCRVEIRCYPKYEEWVDIDNDCVIMVIKKPDVVISDNNITLTLNDRGDI